MNVDGEQSLLSFNAVVTQLVEYIPFKDGVVCSNHTDSTNATIAQR